jgi:hypothetical protein
MDGDGFFRENVETGSTERSMLHCRLIANRRKNGNSILPRVCNTEVVFLGGSFSELGAKNNLGVLSCFYRHMVSCS